jgi:hypothetical protein
MELLPRSMEVDVNGPRPEEERKEVGEPFVEITRYAWADEGEQVKIYVGADNEPEVVKLVSDDKKNVACNFTQEGIVLKVTGGNASHVLLLSPLSGLVVPEESKFRISPGKRIVITLKKRGGCTYPWYKLVDQEKLRLRQARARAFGKPWGTKALMQQLLQQLEKPREESAEQNKGEHMIEPNSEPRLTELKDQPKGTGLEEKNSYSENRESVVVVAEVDTAGTVSRLVHDQKGRADPYPKNKGEHMIELKSEPRRTERKKPPKGTEPAKENMIELKREPRLTELKKPPKGTELEKEKSQSENWERVVVVAEVDTAGTVSRLAHDQKGGADPNRGEPRLKKNKLKSEPRLTELMKPPKGTGLEKEKSHSEDWESVAAVAAVAVAEVDTAATISRLVHDQKGGAKPSPKTEGNEKTKKMPGPVQDSMIVLWGVRIQAANSDRLSGRKTQRGHSNKKCVVSHPCVGRAGSWRGCWAGLQRVRGRPRWGTRMISVRRRRKAAPPPGRPPE